MAFQSHAEGAPQPASERSRMGPALLAVGLAWATRLMLAFF